MPTHDSSLITNHSVRLLPFSVGDGAYHMAADEVMLEAAAKGQTLLRLYRWQPATLSLGYFQRHEDRLADPQLAAMPWVRRATGGGAIVHDNDLTYAIALPKAVRGGLPAAEWHCRVHHVIAELLQSRRFSARVVSGQRAPQADLDFLCFAVPQPGDVILDARKIVGGAQRLRAGALLQHGSIQLPLSDDHAASFGREMAAAFGWIMEEADWAAEEKKRIVELALEKYGQDWWNRKR